jgi:hypothetical protein
LSHNIYAKSTYGIKVTMADGYVLSPTVNITLTEVCPKYLYPKDTASLKKHVPDLHILEFMKLFLNQGHQIWHAFTNYSRVTSQDSQPRV